MGTSVKYPTVFYVERLSCYFIKYRVLLHLIDFEILTWYLI
jgi:hypothetical protein